VRLTPEKARWQQRYCEQALRDPKLPADRRTLLEAKLAFARKVLQGRCRRCLRVLTDPVSIARGVGSECLARETDPRDHQSHVEQADDLADAGYYDGPDAA